MLREWKTQEEPEMSKTGGEDWLEEGLELAHCTLSVWTGSGYDCESGLLMWNAGTTTNDKVKEPRAMNGMSVAADNDSVLRAGI
jgi:hypothetical protein